MPSGMTLFKAKSKVIGIIFFLQTYELACKCRLIKKLFVMVVFYLK